MSKRTELGRIVSSVLQPACSADAIGTSVVAAAVAIAAVAIAAATAAATAAAIAAAAIIAAAIAAAAIAAAHATEFAICSFVHQTVHGFLGSPCGVVRRRVSLYVLEARP